MQKYLVEIFHDREEIDCATAAKVFLSSGSHFLVNADWGCNDDVHKAWMIIDAESKEEARRIIPSIFKSKATIVRLNKYTWEQVNAILTKYHYA